MVIYSTGIHNPKVTTRCEVHPGTMRTRSGGHRILGRTRDVEPHPLPLELLDKDISVTGGANEFEVEVLLRHD